MGERSTNELKVLPCVGSGLCCKKGPCGIAGEKYRDLGPWLRGEGCPSLLWDDAAGRYFCREVTEGPEDRRAWAAEVLYIGAGCCMSLFNDQRERIIAARLNGTVCPRPEGARK